MKKPFSRASRTIFLILFSGGSLFLVVLILGLWGGSGNLADLIAGQLPPPVQIQDRAASVRPALQSYEVSVQLDSSRIINLVTAEFLSFSIDSAELVGSSWWNPDAVDKESGSGSTKRVPFDFSLPRLEYLTRQLAPAFLRIGGSEADRMWYQVGKDGAERPANPAYRATLYAETWDAVCTFAQRCGLKMVFTLNAGPGQAENGTANAESLVRYTVQHNYPVALWEFGNELNGYWFVHGPGSVESPENYDRDYVAMATLVRSIDPKALMAPQSSAFWPIAGEAFSPLFGFMPRSIERIGKDIDLLSWHYYPQQSRRAPFATRRADPARMLDPANLDEAAFWAAKMRRWRDQYVPGKPIWLGETGNAQFGGEPGVSDVYIAGLWWLDELGLMAREGMSVVVRQTLAGSNYGLLDESTLEPRPDYWNSWLWKHFMGASVYHPIVSSAVPYGKEGARKLRVYAQSAMPPSGNGTVAIPHVCMLIINLDTARNALVALPAQASTNAKAWIVTTPDVLGKELLVNGSVLQLDSAGHVPALTPLAVDGKLLLPPLSYAFVQY